MEIPRKFGKYNILSVIGQGSMGTVCKAEQDVIRRIVAIKVLPLELAKEDKRKELRFEYEAKSAARLFHPHIITIFEIGKLSVPPDDMINKRTLLATERNPILIRFDKILIDFGTNHFQPIAKMPCNGKVF